MAKSVEIPNNPRDLPLAVVKQMISLSTSGFGLVAALAWNELVKETINSYIKPLLPENSKIISLFLYAVIVTVLAIFVTLQLTRLQQRLERLNNMLHPHPDKPDQNKPSNNK